MFVSNMGPTRKQQRTAKCPCPVCNGHERDFRTVESHLVALHRSSLIEPNQPATNVRTEYPTSPIGSNGDDDFTTDCSQDLGQNSSTPDHINTTMLTDDSLDNFLMKQSLIMEARYQSLKKT